MEISGRAIHYLIRLPDEPIKRVKCRRVQLDALDDGGQRTERRFVLAASVADEKKAQRRFTLICVHAIADFEGQLTVDPNHLEVDDLEYQEILQRL